MIWFRLNYNFIDAKWIWQFSLRQHLYWVYFNWVVRRENRYISIYGGSNFTWRNIVKFQSMVSAWDANVHALTCFCWSRVLSKFNVFLFRYIFKVFAIQTVNLNEIESLGSEKSCNNAKSCWPEYTNFLTESEYLFALKNLSPNEQISHQATKSLIKPKISR